MCSSSDSGVGIGIRAASETALYGYTASGPVLSSSNQALVRKYEKSYLLRTRPGGSNRGVALTGPFCPVFDYITTEPGKL